MSFPIEVLVVESECFKVPWSWRDFDTFFYNGGKYQLAWFGDEIAGVAYWYYGRRTARLCGIAVMPEYRNQGAGRELLNVVMRKARRMGKVQVIADVSELNTGAHLFFRACGFRATKVLPGHFTSDNTTAYRFVKPIKSKKGELIEK